MDLIEKYISFRYEQNDKIGVLFYLVSFYSFHLWESVTELQGKNAFPGSVSVSCLLSFYQVK